MSDQAHDLRQLRAGLKRPLSGSRGGAVFLIGSGKGGVGKSVLAFHLAAALARLGAKTLLHDGAQNQGNLHVLLGIRPACRLEEVLSGSMRAGELVVPVYENLSLLPGNSGEHAMYALSDTDRVRLHHRLASVHDDFDAVVIDAGPGLDGAIRMSIVSASRLVVVAVPEPASLSDAYALIKLVHLQAPKLPVDVIVNRTMGTTEGGVTFGLLNTAARRFLQHPLRFLAEVPSDPSLLGQVCRPGALLEDTNGPVPRALEEAAGQLFEDVAATARHSG